MKRGERGFTIIELSVATAIVALLAGAATMSTFQIINVTRQNNDRLVVVRQVQNVGYWVSRDALMAEHVDVDAGPDFLLLTWTEWPLNEEPIYHSVRYSFQDLSDGIGKLKRTRQINGETGEQTLVAEYIDSNTTTATYESQVLTVQITSSLGEADETREYRFWGRPNLFS